MNIYDFVNGEKWLVEDYLLHYCRTHTVLFHLSENATFKEDPKKKKTTKKPSFSLFGPLYLVNS